jgi:hypothetical protein
MARMVGHAEGQLDHGGNPAAGPELPPEAVRFGATREEFGQLGELCGGEPRRSSGRRPATERLGAALSGACHPLADGPLADAKRLGDLALGPPLLLEVPGLQAANFFPVGR